MEQENMELFTVAAFASQVGKTTSAIYQQAKGRLKPYIVEGEDGSKRISAKALELFEQRESKAPQKPFEALQSEVNRLQAENERLQDRITDLQGQLAREQEISRERLTRLEAADRRIDSLLDKIPPMLPAGNAGGGGLFGWLKRKKGDTTK